MVNPPSSDALNKSLAEWGVWMPGFMQFLTGLILWAYIAMFHVTPPNPLYMAAVAFTAYSIHWFALGLNRHFGGYVRVDGYMAIAFL